MKKPNGYGCVVDLGKGRRKRYAFRITIGTKLNKNGQYIPQYKYLGYFEKSAQAYDYQARYNSGQEVQEQNKRNECQTVEKIYELWYERKFNGKKEYSVQLQRSYNAAFNKLEQIKYRRLNTVRFNELQDIADSYAEMSRSSVTNLEFVMKELYAYAKRRKWVTENLAEDVEFLYAEKEDSIHKTFERNEIDLLWEHANEKDVQIILCMIYTGVRITEFLIMKKNSIFLDEKYMIGGIKTKAGKNRPIPLADKIYPFVKYLVDKPGDYLLTQPNKHRYSRDYFVDNIWTPVMGRLGLEHLPHDTKYTCATLMDRAGVNENCRKIILGHARQGVTNGVYTQKDMQDLLEAINKI